MTPRLRVRTDTWVGSDPEQPGANRRGAEEVPEGPGGPGPPEDPEDLETGVIITLLHLVISSLALLMHLRVSNGPFTDRNMFFVYIYE